MIKIKSTLVLLIIFILTSIGLPIKGEEVFSDIQNHPYKDEITQLYLDGIVKGVGNQHFNPDLPISNAQALQLYVNVFKLNLDRFRFFKKPEATDYFEKAVNNAWYADALINAGANGMEADRGLIPNGLITRESFYQLLINQMESQYSLPKLKLLPVTIGDENTIAVDNQGFIQRGIAYGIIALDQQGYFNPKASMTRGESAKALVLMLDYLRTQGYLDKEAQSLQSTLNTVINGKEVTFLFDIHNPTDENKTITFNSSQTFDFNVYNSMGDQVYNWSSVRSFLMMLQDVTIEKDSFVRYEALWDYKDAAGQALPAGSYKVVFDSHFMLGEEPTDLRSEVIIDITH